MNMIEKLKKNNILLKIIFTIILLIVFVLIFKLNYLAHYTHDEYVFSHVYGTEQKVNNFADLYNSMKSIYNMDSGRILILGISQILCMINIDVFKILNTLVYILLMYMIYKFGVSKKDKISINNILILLFVCVICFVKIPAFGQTVINLNGSVNYLWVVTLLIINLYTFYKIVKYENYKVNKFIFTITCILSFFLGASHEIIAVMNTAVIILVMIYEYLDKRRIDKLCIISSIFSILGMIFLLAAPGNYVRKALDVSGKALEGSVVAFDSLRNTINQLYNTIINNFVIFLIITIALLYIIINGFKNKKFILDNKKHIFLILLYTGVGILPYFAMMFSVNFDTRVTFAPFVFFLIAFFEAIKILKINEKSYFKIFFVLITTIFLIISVKNYYNTYKIASNLSKELDTRDELINKQKNEGISDVKVPKISLQVNDYITFSEISYNTNYTANKSMATYYNLSSIKLEADYYCRIIFSNLKSDSTNQINISDNSTFDSSDYIRMLDKKYKDKLAPYKKDYYAFEGEEYTLNFGINSDSINQFSVIFKNKFSDMYIKQIVIFDKNDKVIYNLSPNKINDSIDNKENLAKIEVENNLLHISSTQNNSYFHIKLN